MVLAEHQLRHLAKGGEVTVETGPNWVEGGWRRPCQYVVGRDYAAQQAGKRAKFRVTVREVLWDVDAVVWVVRVRRQTSSMAPAKLLHKKVHRGYTKEPSQAVWGEPEAIDSVAQTGITEASWTYHLERQEEKLANIQLLGFGERVLLLQDAVRRSGQDFRAELRAIRRMDRKRAERVLDEIERRVHL